MRLEHSLLDVVREMALRACASIHGEDEKCDLPCDLCWQEAAALVEEWANSGE